jgi:hypothetical protein
LTIEPGTLERLRALAEKWRAKPSMMGIREKCADELDALASDFASRAGQEELCPHWREALRNGAEALSRKWATEAHEADQDGDFCCAQTRRFDAGELFDLIRKVAALSPSTKGAKTPWPLTRWKP